MKKRLSVPPTKSALLQVGREARFLEQGRQMLEKKRDLLTAGWASCRCAWARRCCVSRRPG
jgi:vacuolar-type H+-ATPase subunit D/Vma8